MGTIGVYVDDDALVERFDHEAAAFWPGGADGDDGQQYHRSATLRCLMTATTRAAPDLVEAGVLPPDDPMATTAREVEQAVAAELMTTLRIGAAVRGTAADLGWRERSADEWVRSITAIIREHHQRDLERRNDG